MSGPEARDAKEEKRARAIAWYTEGRTIADISDEIELPSGTVWNWLNKAGLIRPRAKALHRDQVLADYRNGDSYDVVAARYGISEGTARNWVRNAGLKGQGGLKSVYAQKRREAVALYLQGKRNSEIAETLGLHQSVVSKWLKEEEVSKSEGGSALAARMDAKEAVRLYGNGATIEIIARHLKRGEKTVAGWLDEAGIHIQSAIERRTPEQQRAYALLGAAAMKAKAAAQERICEHCQQPYLVKSSVKRKSPQRFCSRKCANDGRRDPENTPFVTCQTCDTEFQTRKTRIAKFCSRACADQGTHAIQWQFEDNVLDSTWEAFFIGMTSMKNTDCKRFDRTGVVTWNEEGHVYGPDFLLRARGKEVAIEIKGRVDANDPAKWAAYRAQGLLAVLDRAELEGLMPLSNAAFASRLIELAVEQGAAGDPSLAAA